VSVVGELAGHLQQLTERCQESRDRISLTCADQREYNKKFAQLNDTMNSLSSRKLSVVDSLDIIGHTRQVTELSCDLQDKDSVLELMSQGLDEFKAWTDTCKNKMDVCRADSQRMRELFSDELFVEAEEIIRRLKDELNLNVGESLVTVRYNKWKKDSQIIRTLTTNIENKFNDLFERACELVPSLKRTTGRGANEHGHSVYSFSCADLSEDDFLKSAANNFVALANKFWTIFCEVKEGAAITLSDCESTRQQAYDTYRSTTSVQFNNVSERWTRKKYDFNKLAEDVNVCFTILVTHQEKSAELQSRHDQQISIKNERIRLAIIRILDSNNGWYERLGLTVKCDSCTK